MKRSVALILAFVMLAAFLAACGKSAPVEETKSAESAPVEATLESAPEPTSAPASEPAPAPEPEPEPASEPEPEPVAEPEPTRKNVPEGKPSREDMRGHGEIAVPRADAWLDAYDIRYVQSSGGVAAYLFTAPERDMDLHFDDVLDGTELLLLAEQNGFYLAKMDGNRLGWIGKGMTSENTALLDSVPDLSEGVWVLGMGEGENNTFAVKFDGKRSATLIRPSDGAKLLSGWILSGRRVCLDGKYFIWDGEKFVSRDEYQTAAGKIRCTLSFDADGKYKDLF